MNNQASIVYTIASSECEFEQIHEMNYQTFVEEIPQHEINESHYLVDRFHDENTYVIAKKGEQVIGMIAVRDQRPFSLDQKLPQLDTYLNDVASPCEIRLLSIDEAFRKRVVFFGLIDQLSRYCLAEKYDVALISGTVRELELYRKLGFEPFGPRTGTNEASFQPMKLTKSQFVKATQVYRRILARHEPISFLSGPVPVTDEVAKAWTYPSLSHRSTPFINLMEQVRNTLCSITQASHTSILVGTGTLANDVVAHQIKRLGGEGLILSNGEFGHRLIDHAERAGVSFQTIQKPWNDSIQPKEIRSILENNPMIQWIWTVHCETSTGYLYDIESVKEIAREFEVKLCLDACSSFGVDELNLSGIHLASSVSGKGVGSYPGLAIVFHSDHPYPDETIPRYLDLGMYARNQGVPYTHSSNLLSALEEALKNVNWQQKSRLMELLRTRLHAQGWNVLGNNQYSKGIVTIEFPPSISVRTIGDRLKKQGISINYESRYLSERNWGQIALMGHVTETEVTRLTNALQRMKQSETRMVRS